MKPGRLKHYDKPLQIVELYYCIQSEGSRAGKPTVAIRTTGCTHRCWFGDGGWCDSWYTSVHPEKGTFTFNDIIKMYDDRPDITEMMLTGGSPTMHPDLVNELTHFANERGIVITIETEGSHFIETDFPIGLISLSPKFSNSVPKIGVPTPKGELTDEKMVAKHNSLRLNKEAIKQTLAYHTDYHFKPVCNPVEMAETWEEIENFRVEMEIPKSKTWLMPPGDNRKELIRVYPMVFDFCTENGYNFTGREHIISYDTRRGV
jgi:7-carboxy-7-deazaguanine synthase